MSITIYIQALKEKKDISYMQLAKDIGITYQNMMAYKNGLVSSASLKLLKKLSIYENRTQEQILFDIFKSDVNETYSDLALMYLCRQYINDSTIQLNTLIPNPYFNDYMTLDGSYSKKRIGNSVTLVQTWQNLCIEHWDTLKIHSSIAYDRDAYIHIFRNENVYIANVIAWAIQRIQVSNDPIIKGYDILFENDKQNFYYKLVSKYLPQPKYIKINLVKVSK